MTTEHDRQYPAYPAGAGPDEAEQAVADEHAGAAGQEYGTLVAPGAFADSGTADSGVLADSGSSTPMEPSTPSGTRASASASGLTDDHSWREILASFVDDPRDAVRKATELIENDVSAYIALLNERQDDIISTLPSDQGAQTEELRQALLACRDFSRRLAASLRVVR